MSYQRPYHLPPAMASRLPANPPASRIGRPKSIRLSASGRSAATARPTPPRGATRIRRPLQPVQRLSTGGEGASPAPRRASRRVSVGGVGEGPEEKGKCRLIRPTSMKVLAGTENTSVQSRVGPTGAAESRIGSRVPRAAAGAGANAGTSAGASPAAGAGAGGSAAGSAGASAAASAGRGRRRLSYRPREGGEARRVSGGAALGIGIRGRSATLRQRSAALTGRSPVVRERPTFGLGRRSTGGEECLSRGAVLPDRGAEAALMSPAALGGLSGVRRLSGARLSPGRVGRPSPRLQESPYGGRKVASGVSSGVRRVSAGSQGGAEGRQDRAGWRRRLGSASELLRKARRASFSDCEDDDELRQLRSQLSSSGQITPTGRTAEEEAKESKKESPSTPPNLGTDNSRGLSTPLSDNRGETTTPPARESIAVRLSAAAPRLTASATPILSTSAKHRLSTSATPRRKTRFSDANIHLKNVERLSQSIGRRRSRGASMTKEDLVNTPTPTMRFRQTKLLDLNPSSGSPSQSSPSPEPALKKKPNILLGGEEASTPSQEASTLTKTSATEAPSGKENNGQKILSDDLSWIEQDEQSKSGLLTTPENKKERGDDLDEDLSWAKSSERRSPLLSHWMR